MLLSFAGNLSKTDDVHKHSNLSSLPHCNLTSTDMNIYLSFVTYNAKYLHPIFEYLKFLLPDSSILLNSFLGGIFQTCQKIWY